MKANSTFLSIFFLQLIFSSSTFSQSSAFTVSGKVTMADRKQAIEFATVMLLDKDTQEALAGTTTDIEGNFIISSSSANVVLNIRFIGFESLILEEITFTDNTANLGVIPLKEQVQILEEVEIRAEKSQTEFRLDKRIFNV
ncbi:MAG: carboxypeptidase-like regulatory domain-containing protein, partial [Bacteroidota bacterium]